MEQFGYGSTMYYLDNVYGQMLGILKRLEFAVKNNYKSEITEESDNFRQEMVEYHRLIDELTQSEIQTSDFDILNEKISDLIDMFDDLTGRSKNIKVNLTKDELEDIIYVLKTTNSDENLINKLEKKMN